MRSAAVYRGGRDSNSRTRGLRSSAAGGPGEARGSEATDSSTEMRLPNILASENIARTGGAVPGEASPPSCRWGGWYWAFNPPVLPLVFDPQFTRLDGQFQPGRNSKSGSDNWFGSNPEV